MSLEALKASDSLSVIQQPEQLPETGAAENSSKKRTILIVSLIAFALLLGMTGSIVGALGAAKVITTIPYNVCLTLIAVGILLILAGIAGICTQIRAQKKGPLEENQPPIQAAAPSIEKERPSYARGTLVKKDILKHLSNFCYLLSNQEIDIASVGKKTKKTPEKQRITVRTEQKPKSFASDASFDIKVDEIPAKKEDTYNYVWDQQNLKVFLDVDIMRKTTFTIDHLELKKINQAYRESEKSDQDYITYLANLKEKAESFREKRELQIQLILQDPTQDTQCVKEYTLKVPDTYRHYNESDIKAKLDIHFEPGLVKIQF